MARAGPRKTQRYGVAFKRTAVQLGAIRNSHLTGGAIEAALRRRRPAAGLIFHSGRGSEFLGTAFRQRLAQSGV